MGKEAESQEAAGAETDAQAVVFEQYKLAVEMADRVSARRTTANSFFAAVHTALLTVLSAVFVAGAGGNPGDSSEVAAGVAVAVGGVVLAALWFLLLRSYRDLNQAKFKVIQDMETHLPVAVFADEWNYLNEDPIESWRGRYAELGTVERLVPAAFAALYVAAGVWIVAA